MSTVTKTHELKGLQSQLSREQSNEKSLKVEVSNAQKKLAQCQALIRSLETQIKNLQTSEVKPIVSEHAILRYLQRAHNLDLEMVRESMLANGVEASIAFAKTGKVVKNGLTYIVKDNVVVTVE